MQLILIRHGKAEDRSLFSFSGKKDKARALTESGRRQMRKVAAGLRTLVSDIDVLVTSPLVRAQQTAAIVADVFAVSDIVEQPSLAPGGDASSLLAWLARQPTAATIAVVGHEPDLSHFAGLLIAGNEESFLMLKKGACALIEFTHKPVAGRGRLVWLMQPSVLRKLG